MRLADFIDANTAAILAEWDVFAASLMPAAGKMDAAALRDHAEQILQAISKDLRTPQTRAEQAAKSRGTAPASASETAAQTHALLRAKGGFTVRQLVAEYRALRASVLRLWGDAHPGGPYGMEDMGRFNEAIDQAVAESVDYFSAEVDRWRSVFLGVVAHDLRGPLNTVVVTSRLLSSLAAGQPADEHVERLVRSGERMRRLLDDLLDYSRTSLEIGIPISPERVDLAAVCSEEVGLLRGALPGVTIEFAAHGRTFGSWDGSRIRQVVSNLVNNAARYGDPGGPIRVRLLGEDDRVCLSVENRGAPIPKETLGSLFEPLQRGTPPQTGGHRESLGLGLFIVCQIALAHGGSVDVDSRGRRTVFTVTLPIRQTSHPRQEAT